MIAHFFIDRPIFASVVSILITLVGAVALVALPIAQYPDITPPTVQVSCSYPGASADVLSDTVAAPIEQQVNGVEGMLYMSSTCDNLGNYNLTVTFDLGTDLNEALVLVQNRVQLAMPQLPQVVQRQGVNVKKKSPNILLAVNLWSPDGRYDDLYLSNYATIQIKDELFRLEGVGDIQYLGQRDYSIRVWLDPQQMSARDLTASEVVDAIRQQNLAAALGQVGQPPVPAGQSFQWPLDTLGRLVDPEQFGRIVVKAVPGGADNPATQLVYLRDIARIDLGATKYDQSCTLDGHPSVALAIFQLPGTNALDVADAVKARMRELEKRFPQGLAYEIVYDTTPFIQESVRDVVHTLRDAVILVAIVVLVFLQNWRATLIPLLAVPVAIIGTFAVMAALGFSINNISLFGLVLAIGIVVDDAIVVVENVERWLEQGLPAREAARKAMDEVTGPVVAVALVLCAVFVPCAFIAGITGQFFRQFAITIAVSTVFSAINSLTLSPALAALLLKPHGAPRDLLSRLLHLALGWFFWLFNRLFRLGTSVYTGIVGLLLRASVVALAVYGGLLGLTAWSFTAVPEGFIPEQDQGWLLVNAQLPDSFSVQRTQEVMARVERIALQTPGVAHTLSTSGQSILMNCYGSNFGSMFVILDRFEHRRSPHLHGEAIMDQLRRRYFLEVPDAIVTVFGAPPVNGLGTAGGFQLMIEDRGSLGLTLLQNETDRLIEQGRKQPDLVGLFTIFRSDVPQLYLDIDRAKVRALGVELQEVFDTLNVQTGSLYVNNFNEFGRFWQVNVMAEGKFRNRVESLNLLQVRNRRGEMVPLGTVTEVKSVAGPPLLMRYNLYPAAPINGSMRPGVSSGQAIATLDALAERELPRAMASEWTNLTYMQIKAGNTAQLVFALAVIFVFLVLAALYESWSLPLAVILVVPMCLLCSLAGVAVAGLSIDIFVQIGFVVLVGLASKNAILIVEFAKAQREAGVPAREATTEACRLRLRPILMTSFAFILGVVPLVLADGAGAEMRHSLGTAVFSGMLGVTLFGIFLTPVFFYVIQWLSERPLFRHLPMQWAVSGVSGAGCGGLVALLLGELDVRPLLALVMGAALGTVVAGLVMRLHHRMPTGLPRQPPAPA